MVTVPSLDLNSTLLGSGVPVNLTFLAPKAVELMTRPDIVVLPVGVLVVFEIAKLAFDVSFVAVSVISTAEPFFTVTLTFDISADAFAVRWPAEVAAVALAMLVSVLALPVSVTPPLKAVVFA